MNVLAKQRACRLCGAGLDTGYPVKLVSHYIIPRRVENQVALRLWNLPVDLNEQVTLCHSCHGKIETKTRRLAEDYFDKGTARCEQLRIWIRHENWELEKMVRNELARQLVIELRKLCLV